MLKSLPKKWNDSLKRCKISDKENAERSTITQPKYHISMFPTFSNQSGP